MQPSAFHIAAGTKAEEPLELPSGKEHAHLLVTIGEGAEATLIQRIAGDQAMELAVGDHARVTFICIVTAPPGEPMRLEQRSRIGAHASLHVHNVTLGGKDVTHECTADVEGEESRSDVDWIFHAQGKEKQRLAARTTFRGRNGGGDITMKGVAEGHAHVGCYGMIEIGEGGGGTESFLTQHVLMLDHTSKVDAVPGLEIKTNDVSASHSATVTKVSPEDLFYLGSRGIGAEEARRMLTQGFLRELLTRIPSEETRRMVEGVIARAL